MALNALQAVDDLVEEGVPENQAKAQVRLVQKVVESELATKLDIAEVKRDIADIRKDIATLEVRLSMRITIAIGSFAALILAALVTLAKLGLLTP